jgi:hypothetical protein
MQTIPAYDVTQLMPHLRFNADDLSANRAGRLGPTQRARIQHMQRQTLWFGAGGFSVLALLATSLIFSGQQNAAAPLSAAGVLMTLINAILVGTLGRQWMRLSRDLRAERVETLHGELERVVRPGRQLNNYVLRIAARDFPVKKGVFRLFEHEAPYAFYVAPASGVLLAAEPQDAGS